MQQYSPTVILERVEAATPQSRIVVVAEPTVFGSVRLMAGFFDTVVGRQYAQHPGFIGAFSNKDSKEKVLSAIREGMDRARGMNLDRLARFQAKLRKRGWL